MKPRRAEGWAVTGPADAASDVPDASFAVIAYVQSPARWGVKRAFQAGGPAGVSVWPAVLPLRVKPWYQKALTVRVTPPGPVKTTCTSTWAGSYGFA